MTERPSADTAATVRSVGASRAWTAKLELRDLRKDFDLETLEALYREILAPSFPVEELDSLQRIAGGLTSDVDDPVTHGIVAMERGTVVGGLLAEHYRASEVLLIAYLAVSEALRGRGIGLQLLTEAASRWYEQLDVALAVAEVHDPRRYASIEGASAGRRLSFYGRAGARVLDMPFIQPSLEPQRDRVRGLLLLAFYVAPRALVTEAGARCVDPAILRGFLRHYYSAAEGKPPETGDREYRELESHVERPVRLLPVHSIERAG